MHELLKRQLLRYRGSLEISDDWRACIEVINALPEDIAQKKLATLKEFEEGIKFYREGKYTEAITNFNLVLKNNSDDKAAHVYLVNATSKK